MSKRKEKPEQDTPMHIRLNPEELAELDTIVGWMKRDPKLRRLKSNLGRAKAIRYAIGHIIDNPPAHVESGQG